MKTYNDKTKHWKEISKKLKGWERRLIELRNSGAGYNEIRDLLQREFPNQKKGFKTNQQLRTLLYKGGRLSKEYNIYSEMMAEESFEQGQLILKNIFKQATMTIANLLSKSTNDAIRLNAAKEILARKLGTPVQMIENKDSEELEELREKLKDIL